MRLRLLTAVSLLALVLALAACGNKGTPQGKTRAAGTSGLDPATTGGEGESIPEGQYAQIGGLKYQVQLAREMNPTDREDSQSLTGLDAAARQLSPKDTFFGVWMRVQYDKKDGQPLPTARDFVMFDTQGNQWRPIPLGADNVFAYRPLTLSPSQILPQPDTAAAESTVQGALLLFRLPFENLQNRPLVLHVTNPQDNQDETQMGLDV